MSDWRERDRQERTRQALYYAEERADLDRRIQENIKYDQLFSWTQLTDSEKYMEFINHVREIAKKAGTYHSIAEFELIHFERRLNN